MSTYVGGFLSNPALLILAAVWIVKSDISKGIDRLFLVFCFILAVPILIGGIEFQTRVLFNIPFHLIAASMLFYSSIDSSKKNKNNRHSIDRYILLAALIAVSANYALRAMANLYPELPEGYVLERQFLLP
jgi:hypothetical protein